MGDEEGEGLFAGDRPLGALLTSVPKDEDEEEEEEEEEILFSIADEDAPMKAQSQILNVFNEPIKKRRKTTGPASVGMPDFAKMTAVGKNARTQD